MGIKKKEREDWSGEKEFQKKCEWQMALSTHHSHLPAERFYFN